MAARSDDRENRADREICLTRSYDAPRALVWRAWTEAERIAQWWGPTGFTTTTHEMNVRPGGLWRFVMHGPDGRDYMNLVKYVEVKKPERLVYDQGGEGDTADISFHVTVTFVERNGKTEVTLRTVFPTAALRNRVVEEFGAIEGGKQTLARLAEHLQGLSGNLDFVTERVFDAARDLVWRAWTDVEQLKLWWGPKGFTVTFARLELRPGGVFHYGLKSPTGEAMWGRFLFREVVAPERLVYVLSFSDEKGDVARHRQHESWPLQMLTTVTFAEEEGKRTRLTLRAAPLDASESECRTFLEGHDSMRAGFGATFDQLAAYLAGR